MKRYKVLWIDDEAEKQEAFIEAASIREGIIFTPFKTNKAGIDDLKKNLTFYDAIVLDAKGFEESEDERAALTGLQNSIKAINALSDRKPYFILSGYLDKDEYGTAREMLNNEEIFTKGKDNDRLFQRIKEEADKQPDTQIRHEHWVLFEALESYDESCSQVVLEILRAAKTGASGLSDHLYFTPLRLILEEMFRKANEAGLLHDACVNVKGSQVNLTESSKFLAGEDCEILKVRSTKIHFPKLIANHVKNILFTTGAASHTSKVDTSKNIDVQAYRKEINSPYLLLSLVYQLADVLIWFHQYCRKNPDVTKNKSYWQDIAYDADGNKWIEGAVERVARNGWGTFASQYIPCKVSVHRNVMVQENFTEGDKVRVTMKTSIFAENIERL